MGRRVKADHLRVIRRIDKEMPADAKDLAQEGFGHDLGGGANGAQLAILQDADPVAERGLVQVVQGNDRRRGQALDQLAADLNAPDTWAQSRRAAFNDSTPLRFDGWREDMAGTPYPDLIAPLADAWVGLVRVSDVGDVEAVVQWAAAQRASGVDVRWRDTIAAAQRQLAAARQGAARVLVLAAAAVLLVLGLRYGTRGAVTVALPSLLAVA